MNCDHWHRLIENYTGGTISAAELTSLLNHCDRCTECNELVQVHAVLSEPQAEPALPSELQFAAMRRGVLRSVGLAQPRPTSSIIPWLAAAAALIVGLGIGLLTRGSGTEDPGAALLAALGNEARIHARPEDFEHSPFLIDSVSLRSVGGGGMQARLDLKTHLVVEAPIESELAEELVARALLEPRDMPSRIEAVAMASQIGGGKVTRALLDVLATDPDLPVRLLALDQLGPRAGETDIRAGLLGTVVHDPSTQVRMVALGHLARVMPADDLRAALLTDAEHADPALIYQIQSL